jgi:60s Acidic ribosomal protein
MMVFFMSIPSVYRAEAYAFHDHQAKEYLANPEAFAVAAAPVAEAAAPAEEAAAEKKEEEAEESDGDMVSIPCKSIRSVADDCCVGLRSVRLEGFCRRSAAISRVVI